MATGDAQLFEDTFTVTDFDQSKYDRVGRLTANSTDNQTQMTLDVNIELFPVLIGENLQVVLATTLALDGNRENEERGWRDVRGESTLADMYDYVCHGKIYRFEDGVEGQTLRAYISFGGLLMMLEGPYAKLTPLRVDNTYLLVKK
ncbi:DNA-directed RNA polymerases and 3 polypeptide [Xylaria bambusicola]|uniref:DNA-directed RNA polymerases and 3 polypeptide n=1 Tax=Xylaria bambusicola TaxID=326684 RepID=UPI0020085727|nr:DNA-directed RNA polymerases and 3 polypeptide [Xylaria bambusicola]KAI0508655.1 DNA-directed RNA polymerases and 3 polypeptide [Xylaria bambusicola]